MADANTPAPLPRAEALRIRLLSLGALSGKIGDGPWVADELEQALAQVEAAGRIAGLREAAATADERAKERADQAQTLLADGIADTYHRQAGAADALRLLAARLRGVASLCAREAGVVARATFVSKGRR